MSSGPNMATITASLERSLQNCSINNHHHQSRGSNGSRRVDDSGRTRNPASNSVGNHRDYLYSSSNNSSLNYYSHRDHDAALDLNSHISLPYQWEQCLDLKSGEIYYINWRTGMKAKEDPRMSHRGMILDHHYDSYYTEEEEEEDDDDDEEEEEDDEEEDDSSSSSSSSEVYSPPEAEAEAESASSSSSLISRNVGDEERNSKDERSRQVLVVAGCKVCLMYFMVPKQVQLCPKCTSAQLLHF
ncbi:protein CURLY FLAG LEAF 1 [Apium graveolens]|uniref:protein CURLY FLAG LEAF 1 n=1 Tax=Apium graveolens TaxID=4045 RepID=UPI003D792425